MKNLKKWINLFVLIIFISFEILTPITYAVEESFTESEPIVVEENIWEDSFDEVENEDIPLDNAQTDEGEESETDNTPDVSLISVDSESDQNESEDTEWEKCEEKSWGDAQVWNIDENEEILDDSDEIHENLEEWMEGDETMGTWENEEYVLDLETELEAIETWDIQLMEGSGENTSITVTHNANWWQFLDGSEEKVAVYSWLWFGW